MGPVVLTAHYCICFINTRTHPIFDYTYLKVRKKYYIYIYTLASVFSCKCKFRYLNACSNHDYNCCWPKQNKSNRSSCCPSHQQICSSYGCTVLAETVTYTHLYITPSFRHICKPANFLLLLLVHDNLITSLMTFCKSRTQQVKQVKSMHQCINKVVKNPS